MPTGHCVYSLKRTENLQSALKNIVCILAEEDVAVWDGNNGGRSGHVGPNGRPRSHDSWHSCTCSRISQDDSITRFWTSHLRMETVYSKLRVVSRFGRSCTASSCMSAVIGDCFVLCYHEELKLNPLVFAVARTKTRSVYCSCSTTFIPNIPSSSNDQL